MIEQIGIIDLPITFAAGLYDDQTKLTRFGVRDYESTTGRWTSKDQIGFSSGTNNFYEYVSNDPINRFDSQGLLQNLTHYAISFDAAIAVGFSVYAANKIALASAGTDFLPLSSSTSSLITRMHAMSGIDPKTGTYQSPLDSRRNTANFIRKRLASAKNYKNNGDCDSYYSALGDALHASQDQWAELHNYEPWDDTTLSSIAHFFTELNPSMSSQRLALGSSILTLLGNYNGAIRR